MATTRKDTDESQPVEEPSSIPQPTKTSEALEERSTPPVPNIPLKDEGKRPSPPIAGIGASAGGLDAFKKFFVAMPADSGIGFVLVPHLDPGHESLMVELLARQTAMPVTEATEGILVEANQVYIIPPNKYMTIKDGVLRLTGPVERNRAQTSIDLFLHSLAEDKQEKAICIILSGTGSHGSLGLKAIKAAGGLAIVQDPTTASYPLMPQSAIATGLADYVLPVDQMPEALIKYIQHYYVNDNKTDAPGKEVPDHVTQLLALIRTRTKLDFRAYRKKMLVRRIERRMSLNHLDRIVDYLAFLREHPDEVKLLSRDLLLGVTSFFRDPDAWGELETQIIEPLVRAKEPDVPIRIWSAGCATGEEPYSLGMLILEHLSAMQKYCPVQIFATDVDEDSLEIARQGTYPESISANVSPERLERFFTRVNDSSYQVSKQLRETVTFARQNVLSDAPFSRLDLVVCRNLLIYLEPEVQKSLLTLLHFALAEEGVLFLGTSETIGQNVDLFEPISAKWRIYRRIGQTRVNDLKFPAMQLDSHLGKVQPESRLQAPPKLAELAQNFLLRRYALACVVINRNCEVLHFAGPTEDYLVQPSGPPTQDLFSLAREGLESKLRVVIQRAIHENAPQSVKDVTMRHMDVLRRVNIEVQPFNQSKRTEGLLLVAFQEQPNPPEETLAEANARMQTSESELVRQIEQELESTREDLQSTIEELESSNEELKASNEEIMSMNEELQSANEELETSKAEQQSLNEELNTVNNQLREKVQNLESVNNDMANLLHCTDIATVFLDTQFRIKRFTPASTQLFNLIPTDIGRPLSDIVQKFADDDLIRDAQQLLRDLIPREKEVYTEDKGWYIRRTIPYRTLDNRIDGVVIFFLDITQRKLASDVVIRRLADIVENSIDAIFRKDLDGTTRTWNRGAERVFGYTADEIIGRSSRTVVPEDRTAEWKKIMTQLSLGEYIEQFETERIRKDGRRIVISMTMSPIRDSDGKVVSVSVIARDITRQKELERDVVEISSAEQRRIGQDLHDTIGQELTALNLLAGDLAETLRTDSVKGAKLIDRLIQGLRHIQSEIRIIMRGLLPVPVDKEGLMAALADLAARTQQEGKVNCQFDCPKPVSVWDNSTATHLYLIAQEAVHNALKHARPQTIRILLRSNRLLVLRVQDDGIGMPVMPHSILGLGLRIMHNRAAIIGARLTIEPGQPSGTVVSCTLERKNHEQD